MMCKVNSYETGINPRHLWRDHIVAKKGASWLFIWIHKIEFFSRFDRILNNEVRAIFRED